MSLNPNGFLACPIPLQQFSHILLGHGGGGRLMHQLIEQLFVPTFGPAVLQSQQDAAVLTIAGIRLAFTTDSYVVNPLFFPGGNIGSLAVNGTVNDLAMVGARPIYLSTAFILEEGFPLEALGRVVESMQQAAEQAQVQLVTGDTKVVERGKGDGLFINTAGIGIVEQSQTPTPQQVKPGDIILLSGDLGRHGIAIMAAREGLQFETTITSDCAPINGLVQDLLTAGVEVHCLRDLTRGGLVSALNEIAAVAGVAIALDERQILVPDEVRGACEILGLDPLYLANEGRFVAFVPSPAAEKALAILRASPLGTAAQIIGRVIESAPGRVILQTPMGSSRVLDLLSGEQLPRIC